uniref:Uncharacterized protein n=1 Tax=uncultured bacterium CBNPD1 BAC clone 543 TaxID=417308 RepID=B1N6I3_9BACT|nr:hypothetical protein [uncultured bacterium CBNPD1 BAC clone 543]
MRASMGLRRRSAADALASSLTRSTRASANAPGICRLASLSASVMGMFGAPKSARKSPLSAAAAVNGAGAASPTASVPWTAALSSRFSPDDRTTTSSAPMPSRGFPGNCTAQGAKSRRMAALPPAALDIGSDSERTLHARLMSPIDGETAPFALGDCSPDQRSSSTASAPGTLIPSELSFSESADAVVDAIARRSPRASSATVNVPGAPAPTRKLPSRLACARSATRGLFTDSVTSSNCTFSRPGASIEPGAIFTVATADASSIDPRQAHDSTEIVPRIALPVAAVINCCQSAPLRRPSHCSTTSAGKSNAHCVGFSSMRMGVAPFGSSVARPAPLSLRRGSETSKSN